MSTKHKIKFHSQITSYDLLAEQELRCEVDWLTKVTIRLIDGSAEIFGTELSPTHEYEFYGGHKFAIFTWHGCSLEVRGLPKVIYTAKETPMVPYLNAHLALNNLRLKAKDMQMPGPRVLLVGDADVGKTTLAKILSSYALKSDFQPLYIDLDPLEGTIMVPTTVGVVATERMDVEELSGFSLNTTPPLLYYFGNTSPMKNPKMFNRIVKRLAEVVEQRMEEDLLCLASGCIIDTFAWLDHSDSCYEILLNAIDVFQVDAVMVVGNERLHSELFQKLAEDRQGLQVIKLPKSGGAVNRDAVFRRQYQMERIREYFYGSPRFELSPYSTSVSFNDISVRRIGEVMNAPTSALPIGATRKTDETDLIKMEVGDVLLHSVLCVSNADLLHNATDKDEESLVTTNLAGFIYIAECDEKKKRLKILSPHPGKLPKRYLWLGTLRWAET